MKPSKYQQDIYDVFCNTEENINISAVAGSGKTTVLVELLKFIPDDKSALFVAFNNSIVDELKKRVEYKPNVEISTIHSYGWRSILCRYGNKVKMNPNKVLGKVEATFKEYEGKTQKRSYYFYIIPKIIDLMRCNLINPNKEDLMKMTLYYDIDIDEFEAEFALKVFEKMNRDKSQFDFMDMIYQPIVDAHIRLQKYDYVFCDESQDFSKAQQEIIKRSLNRKGRLITVGDEHQCQPSDTMVHVAGNKLVKISELKIGDRVVSYDKNSGAFTGCFAKNSSIRHAKKILDIKSRRYSGDLICLKTTNHISKYTPNHRCIVKLNDENPYYVIYLMNRITKSGKVDWRIGQCMMYRYGEFHPRVRLRNEKGFGLWILKICKTLEDAMIWEEIIATKYGITQKCFTWGGNGNKVFGNNKNLTILFSLIREKVNSRINELFNDFKLDKNYPLITSKERNKHFSILHMFDCYAVNIPILSKYLQVLEINDDGTKDWVNIENVYFEKYNGLVYSLKVDKTELYVGDGILTHNSIYGFAGADADSYSKLSELNGTSKSMPLSVCYRCSKSVVQEAQKIVPEISYAPGADEGEVKLGSMREHLQQGDWILCRNLKPLIQTYLWLMKNKVKSKIKGKDIGEGILAMINKTGARTLNGMWVLLEQQKEKLYIKLKNRGVKRPSVHPKMELFEQRLEVIECLMDEVADVAGLKTLIKNIFADEIKGIMLSTIHKAKGLENERVFFICPELIPSRFATTEWMLQQERNLFYTAITRAKNTLVYVLESDFKIDLKSNPNIKQLFN